MAFFRGDTMGVQVKGSGICAFDFEALGAVVEIAGAHVVEDAGDEEEI